VSGFSWAAHGSCGSRQTLSPERRPANALNVEIGTPQPRCTLQPPDGRGVTKDGSTLDYLRSGGSILAYGLCTSAACPKLTEAA
jgi:hypothetical protein